MKMKSIYKKFREMPPVAKQSRVDVNIIETKKDPVDKKSFTPISQAVMDYYQKLMKEYDQFAARNSKAEYRIF